MRFKIVLTTLTMIAAVPAAAQDIDVVVSGARNPAYSTPFDPYGTITIDNLFAQGDGTNPGAPRAIDRGSLSFGDRSFTADQLFYTAFRIEDSLGVRVAVDPALLAPGELAYVAFRNIEGRSLTFPAYTAGPGGFTTGTYGYFVGGFRSGTPSINLSAPTAVPEPGALGLFALALALLVAARRYGRVPAPQAGPAIA